MEKNYIIKTFTGEVIDKFPAIPEKDLTPAGLKIYNYLLRMGPKTELEIRRNPAFDDIRDIGRELRRMRGLKDPYVDSITMSRGPPKWLVLKWPARKVK